MSELRFTQADIDFAEFLAEASERNTPAGLRRREGWSTPPWVARTRAYDNATEQRRLLIHENERRTA